MEPNPLQYSTPNENQPLYRAALLSVGAVVFLIVAGVGLNFGLKHVPKVGAQAGQAPATSPDDMVAGVKQRLTQDAMSTLGGGKIGAQGIRDLAEGNDPISSGESNFRPPIETGNKGFAPPSSFTANSFEDRPQTHNLPPVHASQMRNYASVSPSNLAPLISGR